MHLLCLYVLVQFKNAITPRPDWGPRLKEFRTGAYEDNYGYDPDADVESPYQKNGDIGLEFDRL